MTDYQSGKTEKKRQNKPGKIALMGAGATILAVINMSTGTEAPSPAVLILQYAALVGGLFALVGGLIMMMSFNHFEMCESLGNPTVPTAAPHSS